MITRAFFSFPRNPRQSSPNSASLPRRAIALGLVVLLLPCAQLDLFAQAPQSYPPPQTDQQPQQDYPPPPPDYPQQAPNQQYQQQAPPSSYPQQPPDQQYVQPPQYQQQPPQYQQQAPPQYQQPYPQDQYPQQQPGYPDQSYNQPPAPPQQTQPALAPDQIDQLIAPIALYPDSLIAQILAASTFPEQIASADRWRQSMGYASPQDIAAGANAQPWDPSVKALTAFPQVLSELDQNLSWTTELGNAYYNQPQDVFNAIQAMRQRAQAAGNLQSTPQEAVTNDQGYIDIAPANPQVVYVPAYDPWVVYGSPIAPWPGFALFDGLGYYGVRFGPGLVISAFTGLPWGFFGWGLSWFGNCLFFNHEGYFPQGPGLRDWGLRNGGPRYGWNRSFAYARAYDRGLNRGYDRGAYTNRGYGQRGYANRSFGQNRGLENRAYGENRGFNDPRNGFANRPGYANNNGRAPQQQSFNRMPAFNARPGSGSYGAYGRPNANYGSGFNNRPPQNFQNYGSPAQNYPRPSAPGGLSYGNAFRQPQSNFRSAPTYRAYGGSSAFDNRSFNSGSQHSNSFNGEGRTPSTPHFSGGGFGGGGHSFGGSGGRSFGGGGGGHFSGGGGHSSSHGGGGSHHR
jgi:hypothetical protein